MTLNIIKCHIEQLEEVLQFAKKTFVETYIHLNDPKEFDTYVNQAFTKAQFQSEFNNPNSFFFGIWQDQKLIAFLKLNIEDAQSESMGHEYLEIERIYVDKKSQGKGIGKLLIQKSIANARELKKRKVWLGVWDQNPAAIQFYLSQGFEQKGTHVFKIGNEDQTDLVMELELQ